MSKAAQLAALIGSGQAQGDKNLIINGAMQVAQRGTSATGVGASNGVFPCVDRMKVFAGNTAGRSTVSQVADVHDGFANALKFECTTADTSIAADEFFGMQYIIEGQDVQQLKKGTSDAESFTFSFYVKGNASATYTAEIRDLDNDRINTQTFAVTTSWNRISLTFIPDTTGAFDDDNAGSLQLSFWLHAGSTYTGGTFASNTWASRVQGNRVNSSQTSFFDSTSRTFFITGIQLEVGEVATPFEHESFGKTLQKCQRYYQLVDGGVGKVTGLNSNVQMMVKAAFDMRATPSLAVTTLRVTDCTSSDYADDSVTVSAANVNLRGGRMNLGMSATASVGTVVMLQGTGSSGAPVQLSAEL